ncbi:MAG: TonB-dependent receptor [Pedobacter sp.]|nr:MAG: TonB-dependent receptor [Pedobacter sp.]
MNYFTRLLLPVLLLCLAFTTQAQRSSSIKGKVVTADGFPVVSVTVTLKGEAISTKSNNDGLYQFTKLKKGSYTVIVSAVGLKSDQKTVELGDNDNQAIDFMLAEKSDQLTEVVIGGTAKRYKVDVPSTSLRLNVPLLEIPQNIQIVTSETLADQQIISMSDGVIRNVSGAVRAEHWGDMYTNILMRGSQLQAFRNGFNVVTSFWGPLTEDMSFVDHIEFVKGPAGFMLANGDPAGLYNVVTKKPTGETKGVASFTYGSYDLFRTTLDLDGKVTKNGKFLYRLNVAGQDKRSHRPFEFNNRYSVAPVLSYQFNDKTKITAEYNLQYAKMSDVGSFYQFSPTGYETLPRNASSYQPGLDPTVMNDNSAYLNFEHKFSDRWKVTAQGAYFNYKQRGSSMWPSDVLENGTMVRSVGIWDAKSEMTLGQLFINGNFKTGGLQHRILTGLDVGSKYYQADYGQSHTLDLASAPFDPKNPNYGFPANGFPEFDRVTPLKIRAIAAGGLIDQKYTGVYAQDELGFFSNRVRLTLAGRYTSVTQSSWGGLPISADRFTPRVGLSVSVTDQFSLYGLYDQAFIPQGGRLTSGEKVKPITGSNTEVGAKKDWFNGRLSTTLSAYRILKQNELTGDPSQDPNSGLSIPIGEKTSQGIEFDARGEIFKGLNATVNYAYTDSKTTKVTPGVSGNVGDLTPGFAKHTVNGWLGYKLQSGFLKGSGVSGGFTYLVDRATNSYSITSPEQNLPDYFKLDGGLFWEGKKVKITANVFNILDEYLYSGAFYSGYFASTPKGVYSWQSEAPRNFRVSLAYKF